MSLVTSTTSRVFNKKNAGKTRLKKRPLEMDKVETAAKMKKNKKPRMSEAAMPAPSTAPVRVTKRPTNVGLVLSMGQGDTGQLGQGPDAMESGWPNKSLLPGEVVQVCAGGMHSLCLSKGGEVYSFGCNDEASLGRLTEEEDECFTPAKVDGFTSEIIQVCAGDSHSVALDNQGRLYVWGCFRNHSGVIGINGPDKVKVERKRSRLEVGSPHQKVLKPVMVLTTKKVVKVACGYSHVLCLSDDGLVFSFGAGDFGQLGRVRRARCEGTRHKTFEQLLTPMRVVVGGEEVVDVWAGGYSSFALTSSGKVYAWGLNNYYQLGFKDQEVRYFPERSPPFNPQDPPILLSPSEHHTLSLTKAGVVTSMGRGTYGRLGIGKEDLDVKELTAVKGLQGRKVVSIATGLAVSFAVDDEGLVYSWGMGSNQQLGHGDDEEDVHEARTFAAKLMKSFKGLTVSAGAQHTLVLVQKKAAKN